MERKELYESANTKLQRLYELIFDENGYLKPDFKLTDAETKAFRSYSDNPDNEAREQLETLFGGIIYNKYTYKCSPIIKNIFEQCSQLASLWQDSKYPNHYPPVYTHQAYGWDGNVLFSIDTDATKKCNGVKIGLYNLGGTYEYDINLEKVKQPPKFEDDMKVEESPKFNGKIRIVREKRKATTLSGSTYYEDYGVESYDINQIYSKECMDVLTVAENELSALLNSLTTVDTSSDEKQSRVRK